MRYEARITAYDMFDQVLIGVRVWETPPGSASRAEVLVELTELAQGTGESDPTKWLRAVLERLLEQTAERPANRGLAGRSDWGSSYHN